MDKEIANTLDLFNTDIQKAAEYHGRMASNLLELQYVNPAKISSIVRMAFSLGAKYQRNIIENKPNEIE